MAYSSLAQKRDRDNYDPRYRISVETMDGKTIKG
jgi:hypothetical protein